MKSLFKIILLALLLSTSIQTNLIAVEEKIIENKEEREKKLDTLSWYNWDNPKEHKVKIDRANAEIYILENEYYLKGPKDTNQYSWWTWGKSDSSDLIIYGTEYSVFIEYEDAGYVKLDDWKDVDAEQWINEMRTTAKTNAEIYKKQNLNYIKSMKWIYKPAVDEENNSANYSYEVTWNNNIRTMESKSIALAKSGYLTFTYVVPIEPDTDLVQHATISKEFANTTIFTEGSKYSDYKSGDKIAAVGIGGLVAGSLGVKALAKAGILAKFLPFLAKFWWIILAPIVAIFGFARKGSSSDVATTDDEGKPRRRKRKK